MFAERPIKAFVVEEDAYENLKEGKVKLVLVGREMDWSLVRGSHVLLVTQVYESPTNTGIPSLSPTATLWVVKTEAAQEGSLWEQTVYLERVTLSFFTGDS